MINKPDYSDAPDYFRYYLDLVDSNNLIKELESNKAEVSTFIDSISEELGNYRYAKDKWSIKKVLQHILDCERLYQYRTFRFSRFESIELEGFDVNLALNHLDDDQIELSQLHKDFINLRNSTISLFESLNKEMLDFRGKASGMTMTPRALGFMYIGHSRHHIKVIKEKYLK